MNKPTILSVLIMTNFAMSACGHDTDSNEDRVTPQVEPTTESISGIWVSDDRDAYLVLSPSDAASSDQAGWCRFSGLKDIDWEAEDSYRNAQIEFSSGISALQAKSDTESATTKNLVFNPKIDSCAGTSGALSATPSQEVSLETTTLSLFGQNLKKIEETSFESTAASTLRLLKLLNSAQLGCFIDGKFVATKTATPNC
jgi:hypothetical protein